jgi:predicted DCC family thiol-disulfide oxidoreductase YuxK
MSGWRFKVLYDGECPFCRRDVEWLKRRDHRGDLALEDIAAIGFDPAKYGLSQDEVQRVLHGVMSDGTILKGMDAVCEAYKTVGLGWLVAPTRLPVLRAASNGLYRLFARFRRPLGRFFANGCDGERCAVRPSDESSRRERS